MPTERLSLAQQIAQLEETAPADFDPEDFPGRDGGDDDDMLVDNTVSREHYVDVGRSALRNRLPSVADPKYEGVRISRKDLLNDSDPDDLEDDDDEGQADEDEDEDEEEVDSEGESHDGSIHGHTASSPVHTPSESGEESDKASEDVTEEQPVSQRRAPQTDETEPNADMTSSLAQTRENDMKKGQAVKRQIALWDTLLDTRIRMQKSVVSANRLPQPSAMSEYLDAPACQEALSKFLHEASALTEELAQLQDTILNTNDVVEPPPRKRRKLDDDAPVADYHDVLADATGDVANLEEALHPYLLKTLSKWSAKIQAVAPSVLLPSNRGAFLKGGQNLKSVVQLIDDTLGDREKLLARTQAARIKKPRIGSQSEAESKQDDEEAVDAEVYDDTDFYQKMLRDIIDARGNGNGSANEDWMLLQKQKKAKKKVDTKASKGRKLRYGVHEKIQNFMVPVPSHGSWHDEQIDELFASLLGKGFESIALNTEEPQMQQEIERSGFRVFG
ncbi:hypothetical protein D9619_006125 [Psilocybe cf. subviscida]|uniref:Protein BFR2 n=1 Tax=Psilocybe cf. subviscida TaxID=2480587 RepID=A0A8H5B485_9AGAR|nr:hypothetical protein D9619_006125 [Psilocybe cf. subviscida]